MWWTKHIVFIIGILCCLVCSFSGVYALSFSPSTLHIANTTNVSVPTFSSQPVLFSTNCSWFSFNQSHILFEALNTTTYDVTQCDLLFSSKQTPESILLTVDVQVPRSVPLIVEKQNNEFNILVPPPNISNTSQIEPDNPSLIFEPLHILIGVAIVLLIIGLIKK